MYNGSIAMYESVILAFIYEGSFLEGFSDFLLAEVGSKLCRERLVGPVMYFRLLSRMTRSTTESQ
jgi:hypothetical protein